MRVEWTKAQRLLYLSLGILRSPEKKLAVAY